MRPCVIDSRSGARGPIMVGRRITQAASFSKHRDRLLLLIWTSLSAIASNAIAVAGLAQNLHHVPRSASTAGNLCRRRLFDRLPGCFQTTPSSFPQNIDRTRPFARRLWRQSLFQPTYSSLECLHLLLTSSSHPNRIVLSPQIPGVAPALAFAFPIPRSPEQDGDLSSDR
jgi:hypothetical protein